MIMKGYVAICVLCTSLFVGYLLHAPIPVDMVDQWPYRLLTAGAKTAALITSVRSFFNSDEAMPFQTFTAVFEAVLPAADREVPGSTFTARYTEFDGVKVLIYEPVTKPKKPLPGLVFTHAGGYVWLTTKYHAALTRRFAEELNMVVLAIDYRLAPTHLFPAAFEDCFTATRWFLRHASEYGVDADRVTVVGDSAGGYLASVLVQHVQDDQTLPDIKIQVLLYPWLQSFDFNTPSYQEYERLFGSSGIVPRIQLATYVSVILYGQVDQHFIDQVQQNDHTSAEFKQSDRYRKVLDHQIIFEMLGRTDYLQGGRKESNPIGRLKEGGNDTLWNEIKGKLFDPRLAPLFRQDFKDLPATFIVTCDMDSVRDDGIFYVRLLEEAGVPVTWRNYPGAYHGIAALGPIKDIPTGMQIVAEVIEFIQKNI